MILSCPQLFPGVCNGTRESFQGTPCGGVQHRPPHPACVLTCVRRLPPVTRIYNCCHLLCKILRECNTSCSKCSLSLFSSCMPCLVRPIVAVTSSKCTRSHSYHLCQQPQGNHPHRLQGRRMHMAARHMAARGCKAHGCKADACTWPHRSHSWGQPSARPSAGVNLQLGSTFSWGQPSARPSAGVNLQPGLQLGLTFSWGQPSAGVNLQLGSTFSQAFSWGQPSARPQGWPSQGESCQSSQSTKH